MSEVKTYAVNCNDAWLNTESDDISGSYVKYKDHQEVVAALEAKCAALAAENARMKSAVTQQIELRAEIKKAGRPPHADFWVQSIFEAEEKVKRAIEETPDTDAFLAEIERKAIRKFINSIEHILRDKLSPYDTEEMLEAMRIFLEEQEGEQK